ncbi:MAG: hypothetical protein SH819_14225 [Cytophagales bacterium]|nr:hypothetical protein [Cytophagales bacterium]
MSIDKFSFNLFLGLLFSGSLAYGQAARSPFSSYGLGEQYGTALTQSMGMGGVGFSNPQFMSVNNQNPALLVYNRLTVFQAGLIGEQRTQTSDTLTEKSGNGNLNYLIMSFPVKSGWWTTSLGLMPYSRLNYRLNYFVPVAGTVSDKVDVIEEGTGGVNQFYWSNGVSINKDISVGLKIAYLFSSAENIYSNLLTTTVVPISAKIIDRTFISDFQFSPALSIHLDSLTSKNHRLNIGIVYDFKTNLDAKFNRRIERWNPVAMLDSATVIHNQPGIVTVPGNLMFGISFSKYPYKWTAAVDGSFSDYSLYRDLEGKNPYKSNNWKVAGGFEITPDRNSLGQYLKRVTYRTGVSLENYPFLANGNMVRDFGITFGLSLPVTRISTLDLALKVGKKGDLNLNTIEENYLKLYFGITFNDQWFIKRRFD